MIQEALARTGYDAVLLAEFLGERKLANLRKLIDQARSFDQSGMFTLADFITQLSEFIARQPDEPLAATHPEIGRRGAADDASISPRGWSFRWSSFPTWTGRAAARRAGRLHAAIGPDDERGPDGQASAATSCYRLSESDQEEAELVRLLYVATTRAADYLILSSGLERRARPKGRGPSFWRHFDPVTGVPRGVQRAARRAVNVPTSQPPVGGEGPWGRRAGGTSSGLLEQARRWLPRGADACPST